MELEDLTFNLLGVVTIVIPLSYLIFFVTNLSVFEDYIIGVVFILTAFFGSFFIIRGYKKAGQTPYLDIGISKWFNAISFGIIISWSYITLLTIFFEIFSGQEKDRITILLLGLHLFFINVSYTEFLPISTTWA